MTRALRHVVVGAGVFHMHSAGLELPTTNLVAVSDLNLELGEQRADELGCAFYADYQEMLAETQPEVAVILAPHPFHAELTIACLEAGCHVLVEKPMAVEAREAEADSFYDIEAFGQIKQEWLAQFLELKNGIPSHDTFGRVFACLDPAHFQVCFLERVRFSIGGKLNPQDVLAIDGKQLCGSARKKKKVRAVHMLNVWSHQHGLCLTSTAVDGKSNETTATPGLLDTLDLLDLAGCIITVDALNTQRTLARKVLEKGADYVMALKGNQAVRAHWEVENKLHWTLDVVFGEDAHSYAKSNGPKNMAALRQLALNLLRQDKSKGSLPQR